MSPPTGVICAGNYLVDILTWPVTEVRWDATSWVEQIVQTLGGNGATTSFAMARLGIRVRALGSVGDDGTGRYVLDALEGAGVDVSRLQRLPDSATPATTVLVSPDGARALLHRPGASRAAFTEPVQFHEELIDGMLHFHLANPFGLPLLRPQAAATLARARQAGLSTSLDTGWDAKGEWMEVIGPCLPELDVLFVNRDESKMLTGSDHPDEAAKFFRSRGARIVVIKLGAEGCAVFSSSEAFRARAYEVFVVDSTGAGDSFAGAFLACWLENRALGEAAQFANAVGALCIQSLGGTTGLRSRDETERWIAQHPLR